MYRRHLTSHMTSVIVRATTDAMLHCGAPCRVEVVMVVNKREVFLAALDRGLIQPVGIARPLARATGLSHDVAARWVRGGHVSPETDRRFREALGLDQQQTEENTRRS